MDYSSLKLALKKWCSSEPALLGLAIAGSYAAGRQTDASDIDVCLFVSEPQTFLTHQDWIDLFGTAEKKGVEYWGPVTTVRVFYERGFEVEFNFATLAWATVPVDPGTRRVLSDGFDILYDPTKKLSELQAYLSRG